MNNSQVVGVLKELAKTAQEIELSPSLFKELNPEDIETLNSVFDLLPDKTEFRTEKPDLNIIFNSGSINAISCSGKIESQLGLAISKTDSPEEIADKLVNLLSLSQDKWGDSGKMEEALKLLIGLMMDLSEKAGQTSTHAKKDVRV